MGGSGRFGAQHKTQGRWPPLPGATDDPKPRVCCPHSLCFPCCTSCWPTAAARHWLKAGRWAKHAHLHPLVPPRQHDAACSRALAGAICPGLLQVLPRWLRLHPPVAIGSHATAGLTQRGAPANGSEPSHLTLEESHTKAHRKSHTPALNDRSHRGPTYTSLWRQGPPQGSARLFCGPHLWCVPHHPAQPHLL